MVDFDFIGQRSQQARIKPALETRMDAVLAHCKFILGPEVAELEERLADFVGVKHCITCANGTDALQIAQMALGVTGGARVVTPAFTYIATGEAAAVLGADLDYVDVEADSFNVDPAGLEPAITPDTRAVILTSLFGQTPDFKTINAQGLGVPIIEDAAQSFGATHHGVRSCALTTIATTSFFPTKPLSCYGDGGAMFTDDDDLALVMRQIARHGQDRRYHHIRLGVNSRLDTLQAAVILCKLDHFEDELARRQEVADRYGTLIGDSNALALPQLAQGNTSAWAQYTVRCLSSDRDALAARLKARGVPVSVHYPMPLNQQPSVAQPNAQVPVSDMLATSVLSLPMHAYLEPAAQEFVVNELMDALGAI